MRVLAPVTPGVGASAAAVKARAKSAAVANRSAGNFARLRLTAASTAGGTVSRSVVSGVARSLKSRATMAWTVAPVNGGSPDSISYVTAPSA
jgi:hypothetical protein